jgi:acyl dehydratase
MNALQGSGAWFDDVRVGDRFTSAVTVTETHIVMGAGLIGDFNPHHMNAEFAKTTRFVTPILHGMLTSSIMGAAVGMYFHGTAVAYLSTARASSRCAPAADGGVDGRNEVID